MTLYRAAIAAAALALAAIAGCGSSNGTGSQDAGFTVNGKAFVAASTEAAIKATPAGQPLCPYDAGTCPYLELVISNSVEAACTGGTFAAPVSIANSVSLEFEVAWPAGSAMAPGTHSTQPYGQADDAGVFMFPGGINSIAMCAETGGVSVQDGTVTFTSASASLIAGTYELSFFDSPYKLSGTFSTAPCAFPTTTVECH